MLRPWLVGVFLANILAVGLIVVLAASRPPDAFSMLLAAVAVEVGALAAIQAVAFGRPA
jgi:hypothetical protein